MRGARGVVVAAVLCMLMPDALAVQVEPVVLLKGSEIAACGLQFVDLDTSAPLARAEVLVSRADNTTRFTITGFPSPEFSGDLARIALTTVTYDTRDLFPDPIPTEGGAITTSTTLEPFAGGDLMRELMVSGGKVEIETRAGLTQSVAIPAPVPHGIRQAYLNCSGDLVRPGG